MRNFVTGFGSALLIISLTLNTIWFCPEIKRIYIKEKPGNGVIEIDVEQLPPSPIKS